MYYMYFGTTQSRQLEYCHHQLPNEAKAEINYTPPQHNNKVFSFHFVCGKRVLIWSDRHYCRPLCSISTQEGVEELFFQLYQVLGSLAHFWLELLSSSLTIVTGRHFNPIRYYLVQTHTKFLISLLKMVIIKVGMFLFLVAFEVGPLLLKTDRIYHLKKSIGAKILGSNHLPVSHSDRKVLALAQTS